MLLIAEKIRKLYGGNNYFSVSKIEKYVQCPFAYFIQYGLKAKKRKKNIVVFSTRLRNLVCIVYRYFCSKKENRKKIILSGKKLTNEYCEKKSEHIGGQNPYA